MKIALTIAGSDSGGGAGIQADLKTFHQFGVFGTSAITAVTAQNTIGVAAVHPIPVNTLRAQIDAVLSDLPPQAAKTGMLATKHHIRVVVERLEEHGLDTLVVDPVMVATSGDLLLESAARAAMADELVPRALMVTPNIPEAEVLTDRTIRSTDDMVEAGRLLRERGARAVLIKGGHGNDNTVSDVLIDAEGEKVLSRPRIETTSTHGTGCTLSAAIAACIARGYSVRAAAETAVQYVWKAITTAPRLGAGHGPINHFINPDDL